MARRPIKGKRGNSIHVDLTDVESGSVRVPEGDYQFKITKAQQQLSKTDNEMIVLDVVGTSGKARSKHFKIWLSLQPQTLWKLKAFLEAVDYEIPDSAFDIDLEELVDLTFTGVVTDDVFEGRTRSKIVDYYEVNGEEETPRRGKRDEEEEEEAPTKRAANGKKKPPKVFAEEIDEMSEDELADYVEANQLDVDIGEYKTLGRKQGAVKREAKAADILA